MEKEKRDIEKKWGGRTELFERSKITVKSSEGRKEKSGIDIELGRIINEIRNKIREEFKNIIGKLRKEIKEQRNRKGRDKGTEKRRQGACEGMKRGEEDIKREHGKNSEE